MKYDWIGRKEKVINEIPIRFVDFYQKKTWNFFQTLQIICIIFNAYVWFVTQNPTEYLPLIYIQKNVKCDLLNARNALKDE